MLNLYFGWLDDALLSGNTYFDLGLDFSCITTDFGKKIIAEIEGGRVYSENVIEHDVYGAYTPKELAGGTKSLFILENTDKPMNIVCMGDNCIKYLTDICSHKDVTLCSEIFKNIYKLGFKGVVKILNTGVVVDNEKDFIEGYKSYARNA